MTEENKTAESIPASRRLRAIPKLIGLVALLFIGWFVMTQIVPRLFLDVKNMAPSLPTDTIASQELLAQKDAAIAALTSRIDQLEIKLKTFEEVITTSQGTSGDADQRFAALQEKIAQLESASQQANSQATGEVKSALTSQQADISSMKAEMDKLKTENAARIAAMTAFTTMQDAALQGKPFAHHLILLKEMLATRTDTKETLNSLTIHADKGIAAKAALLTAFESSVQAALSPDAKPDSMLGNLKSLVRIRKVGTPAGTDDESIIARAETALQQGDIEAATVTLRDLSPKAAGAFAAWLQSAQSYVQVHAMLQSLNALIMQPVPVVVPQPEAPKKEVPAAPAAEAPPAPEEMQEEAPAEETPAEEPAELPEESQ